MTRDEAQAFVEQLRQALADTQVTCGHELASREWAVDVREPGTTRWITLPDALSVRAYLDARRGYRAVAGAPDFGPGRV